jgi:hypothetical protein
VITYEFYRDRCGGTADEAAFSSAAVTAEAVIRALLYPASPEDFSESQTDAFLRAVCAQADYSLAEAGTGTGRIRSETLGDRSVTYAEEIAGEVRVNGIPVAPQALLLLGNAGCLSRWV